MVYVELKCFVLPFFDVLQRDMIVCGPTWNYFAVSIAEPGNHFESTTNSITLLRNKNNFYLAIFCRYIGVHFWCTYQAATPVILEALSDILSSSMKKS